MYQKKDYRGYSNSLDYYFAHLELHHLSRTQLSLKDSGLHRKLIREGKIDEAIPEKRKVGRRPLLTCAVEEIISTYVQTKSVPRTAFRTGYNPWTIRKYVREFKNKD